MAGGPVRRWADVAVPMWLRWWSIRARAVYGPAMSNSMTITEARKAARQAQAEAARDRAERDRANVEDVAALLVARDRLAGVDDWQARRVAEIGEQAKRKRGQFTEDAAAAVRRMRERDETWKAIAALTGLEQSELRTLVRTARAGSRALGSSAVGSNGQAKSVGGHQDGQAHHQDQGQAHSAAGPQMEQSVQPSP